MKNEEGKIVESWDRSEGIGKGKSKSKIKKPNF